MIEPAFAQFVPLLKWLPHSGFACVNLEFQKKVLKNNLFLADFEALAQLWVIFGNNIRYFQ